MDNETFKHISKTLENDKKSLIFMSVMDMVQEVSGCWNSEITLSNAKSKCPILNSAPLFEVDIKGIVITENGNMYSVQSEFKKTGGKTWNGDSELFDTIETTYSNAVLAYKLELFPNLENIDMQLCDVEAAAVEIVSELLNINV